MRLFSEAKFFVDWSSFYVASARVTYQRGSGALDAIATLRGLLDRSDTLLVSSVRSAIALSLTTTGDFDGAEREATILLAQASTFSVGQAGALAALALVALHRGQPVDVLAFADRGLKASTSGIRWLPSESILHLVRAEALQVLGRTSDAHAAIREAKGRILTIAATFDDPELRESYVSNVDANARTLKLAREWLGDEAATTERQVS